MKVWLERDGVDKVWVVRHQHCELHTAEAIEDWRSKLEAALLSKGDGRVVLFVDLAGIRIGAAVAEKYGAVAREIAAKHASELFRFGRPEGITASVIQLQAVLNHYPSNLYANRDAAHAALEALMKQKGGPA